MEPPAASPGLGAGERARREEEEKEPAAAAAAAEEEEERAGERRRRRPEEEEEEEEEEEQAGAGPPGGERGGMESCQSPNVGTDSSHSLLSTRLPSIKEEGDLSEFPSVEEGLLTILEEDGRERTGETSCSSLLATEESSTTPHFPLLASSPTHRVWNETLFQQSEQEFAPLRGILDLSEVSESHSRRLHVQETSFPSSSERPSVFCPSSLSTYPQKTIGISTTVAYDTSSSSPYLPHQQVFIDLNKKSAPSHEACHELSRSYRADSVDNLAPVSQRRWETFQKPETFLVRQGQSTLTDDGVSPLDYKFSYSSLLASLEKNRLGGSSSLDSSYCESLKYKNSEECNMSSELESLKSDESKAKRLGDVHSPLFKGELSSKFMSHSFFPRSSQDQSIQNPLGPDVNFVKLSGHNGSTRKDSCDVTFHSGSQHSVKSKLDEMPKPSPKETLDTTEIVGLHDFETSLEPTRKSNSSASQNLLDFELDCNPKISSLSSQTEKSSPGQLTQPIHQLTPSIFSVENLTLEACPNSNSVTSKLQSPFISPNEFAESNPRNHAIWKSQSSPHNQEVSSRSNEMSLPSSDTKDTCEDRLKISPLTQTYSPTLLNVLRHDNSCDYKSQGEASQPLASFKDNTLRTNGFRKDDTDIKASQPSESSIISSGRVAEMLREEKYNINDLPETGKPLQTPPVPFGISEIYSGLPDHFQDGASEHNISPLTFSQTKSHQSPSTTDNKSAPAEALFAKAEVKECEDDTSPPPPEKKVHHHFIHSVPFVPGQVIGPQLLCPNTLRIFCMSPKIPSNMHSSLSGVSPVSHSIPRKFHSRQETSQHSDPQDNTVSQVERLSQQQEQISESVPGTSPKSEKAEEKDTSSAIPFAHLSYKKDFKVISKRVQKLIDRWDSHSHEVSAHTLPMPKPMSTSMNKDGKKVKPVLSDIKELSESGSETDKGLHTLLVEAENIARKRFTNSPCLYSDLRSPRLTKLDNSREVSLTKDSMGFSQKSTRDEKVTPTIKVDTNLGSHFTSQRDTRTTSIQEMESKARVALKETLRQYETVRSASRCEPDRRSTFRREDISGSVRPFTSSNSSSDSSEARVWDPVSECFLGDLPHTPSPVYLGDIRERELISDSDDGCSSEDSLAAHVRHLLRCDPPGSFATQMLRNAEEEESRVRARAWNLKVNLAAECGESVTELDEDDLRKVEEIKASLFGCRRPVDFFQGLPCPAGIRNISETLCEHVFIEAHEKDYSRSMAHEQVTSSSRDFGCYESSEIDQIQSTTASWNALCGSHVKSTFEVSQSKTWRPGSHQLFPCSSSESPCVNMGPTRSFLEEMEKQSVELVGPASVSSPAPISLSSHPPSGLCFETLRRSQFSSDAPLVLQADRGQSSPPVTPRSLLASKSPPRTSVKTLVSSLRKDPVLTGNEHKQVSIDSSVATKRFQEKKHLASLTSKAPDKLQSTFKESQPSSLGVGVNGVAEFPSGISPAEQAKHYQLSHVLPTDSRMGLGHSAQTSLSQPQGNAEEKEDQLKQKSHSSNVADVGAESNITVYPNSPAPGREVSPSAYSSSSSKQRAVSYLRITLSPKASKVKLNDEALKKRQQALDSDSRTRPNDSGHVIAWTSKSRFSVPFEPAPQELTVTSLPDEKQSLNHKHPRNSQPSTSFSRQTQVNSSDLDVASHSKEVQNSRDCETSDHFRKAVSANSLKLSSDAITQITTESSEKTTLSSEIFINSQAHNILNKPPHCPTVPLSLLPYKPSGSAEMYYVPNSAEPPQYPAARSATTLESSHSGSNDAIAPDFPPDTLGKRDENVSDIVTIKHKEGIYSKKTMHKSAWTEEQNPPQEKISESKNQSELQNTTHSVFKSAQFYFHHPVHHHHHHDHDSFSCCEPWGRGTCLTHSRGDFFPFADKDHCFSPPYETSEGEHQGSPLETKMDYTKIKRYCWNVGPDRKLVTQPKLEENLTVGSKVSNTKETSGIHFSLSKTFEPSVTLNELWNRFQERQKKPKPSDSKSLDELSLVDRLDRLAKVLQKPMMLSLQASESTQQKKKGENESLSSQQSSSPPQSPPGGLAGGDQTKPGRPRQLGSDLVSLVSSESGPSSEPVDPGCESDASVQTDGEAGLFGEVSSDLSITDPARISVCESPKQRQQHLSGRQREGSRRVAKWKKSPPASPQVDSVISSDSVSPVSRARSPTPKSKQTVQMLNKAVQTGELEIVRSTRKHTRDFGVTFPTPSYNAAGTRVDKYVNCSSPGHLIEEKKSVDIYLWTKKPRRSKAHCYEESLRCASKKENQACGVSGPSVSWFASLTHTKPWRQPLREQNWQTDDGYSGRLQAPPPVLRDYQETQKRFVKGGLQESLERYRPDFISRSGARMKRLRLIMEERKLQCLLQRERDRLFNHVQQRMESQDVAGYLRKDYVTKRNRTITKKEMVQRSKRIYEQLPEVRKRREEEQRKSTYTTYRYKAQLYKMKITNRVLGRKVPWD